MLLFSFTCPFECYIGSIGGLWWYKVIPSSGGFRHRGNTSGAIIMNNPLSRKVIIFIVKTFIIALSWSQWISRHYCKLPGVILMNISTFVIYWLPNIAVQLYNEWYNDNYKNVLKYHDNCDNEAHYRNNEIIIIAHPTSHVWPDHFFIG